MQPLTGNSAPWKWKRGIYHKGWYKKFDTTRYPPLLLDSIEQDIARTIPNWGTISRYETASGQSPHEVNGGFHLSWNIPNSDNGGSSYKLRNLIVIKNHKQNIFRVSWSNGMDFKHNEFLPAIKEYDASGEMKDFGWYFTGVRIPLPFILSEEAIINCLRSIRDEITVTGDRYRKYIFAIAKANKIMTNKLKSIEIVSEII